MKWMDIVYFFSFIGVCYALSSLHAPQWTTYLYISLFILDYQLSTVSKAFFFLLDSFIIKGLFISMNNLLASSGSFKLDLFNSFYGKEQQTYV